MGDAQSDKSGMQEIPEISREEILKQIFGDIGDLIEDFTCAVESTVLVHGRMYITNKFICFYSNLFGLEKKIRIPYSHIKAITKENTAMVIPNAIAISTDKKDYIFRSFWDREECYKILSAFLAKYRNGGFENYRKSHAAPAANESTAGNNNHHNNDSTSEHLISDGAVAAALPAATVTAVGDAGATTEGSSKRSSVGRPTSASVVGDDVVDTESGFKPQSAAIGDDSAAYEAEVTKGRLKLTVIAEQTLPISVNDFFNLYVNEGCPFSFKKYHETVKDTNLVASTWSELSSSLGHGRDIKFFKPVNLPGLASTRGVKIQRYRRFNDFGMIVCSCTKLEDVPAADAFSVDDMIAVKANDSGGITVEISFQVTFVKSTFMKYIIEKSTNAEMTKWLEAFFNHLKKTSQLFKEGKVSLDAPTTPTTAASSGDTAAAAATTSSISDTADKTEVVVLPPAVAQRDLKTDIVRGVVVLIVLIYLVLSHRKWMAVSRNVTQLENKIDLLNSLVNELIAKSTK